jgi:hypothetical protein
MNKKFLEEAQKLEKIWTKRGLLEGINNRYSRAITAKMLESQRLINEIPVNQLKDFDIIRLIRL